MEHKVLIIGGGLAAVLLCGVVVIRAKAKANAASDNSAPVSSTPDMGYYSSGITPGAVGYASDASSSASTPSVSSNSGTTDTGGGFDISNLLTAIAAGTTKNNASQIVSNEHTSDSAILAGMSISPNGSVSVSHSDTGTTIQSNDRNVTMLDSLYKQYLGRPGDDVGLAYYSSLMKSGKADANVIIDDLKNSNEYKASHPNG